MLTKPRAMAKGTPLLCRSTAQQHDFCFALENLQCLCCDAFRAHNIRFQLKREFTCVLYRYLCAVGRGWNQPKSTNNVSLERFISIENISLNIFAKETSSYGRFFVHARSSHPQICLLSADCARAEAGTRDSGVFINFLCLFTMFTRVPFAIFLQRTVCARAALARCSCLFCWSSTAAFSVSGLDFWPV